MCEMAARLGAEGMSRAQISSAMGVPGRTMREWVTKYPEFEYAMERAKELEQAWWETRAQEGLNNREFNANLWDKSMRARFREEYGTNHVAQEITGKDGKDLIPEQKTDTLHVARWVGYILAKAKHEIEDQDTNPALPEPETPS